MAFSKKSKKEEKVEKAPKFASKLNESDSDVTVLTVTPENVGQTIE